MSLILLASYPKSGNTWMRALLTNYLAADGTAASINSLIGAAIRDRSRFDEATGLSSAAMTADEILFHRPRFHEMLAAEAASPVFAKIHEPFLRLPGGAPLFSPSAFSGAVCIVRNPLDIAVSFAHHSQFDIDRMIRTMNDQGAIIAAGRGAIAAAREQPISDWSENVSSWLDQKELPVRLVSYEAMHVDPIAALEAVVAFAGLAPDPARLAAAVENSRFHRLREQELRDGFTEKQPTAPSFFRKGRVGDWRGVLSRRQVRRLVERHGAMMARLGYLDEAERFLADG